MILLRKPALVLIKIYELGGENITTKSISNNSPHPALKQLENIKLITIKPQKRTKGKKQLISITDRGKKIVKSLIEINNLLKEENQV